MSSDAEICLNGFKETLQTDSWKKPES